jgi:hypothetical protein
VIPRGTGLSELFASTPLLSQGFMRQVQLNFGFQVEGDIPLPAALSVEDVEDHALGVDIFRTESAQLGTAQTRLGVRLLRGSAPRAILDGAPWAEQDRRAESSGGGS